MERRTVVIAGGGLGLVILGVASLRGRVDAAPAHVKASAEAIPTAAPAAPQTAASSSAEARRARDAMRAQILEALRRRAAAAASNAPAPAAPRRAGKAAAEADYEAPGHYDPDYIRTVFREDMFPLLRSCYDGALRQRPKLAGKLVLSFAIVGDPEVGGVVEDGDFAEESTLQDDEMRTCVRESLMTLTFDKPPSGGGRVTVKYPIEFAPGDDEQGDAGSR